MSGERSAAAGEARDVPTPDETAPHGSEWDPTAGEWVDRRPCSSGPLPNQPSPAGEPGEAELALESVLRQVSPYMPAYLIRTIARAVLAAGYRLTPDRLPTDTEPRGHAHPELHDCTTICAGCGCCEHCVGRCPCVYHNGGGHCPNPDCACGRTS